jgi:hypothetical protein
MVTPRIISQPAVRQTVEDTVFLLPDLLKPAALMAGVLGFWRLGVDLNWTNQFVIEQGLFSHWQVWFALAAGLYMASDRLRLAAVQVQRRMRRS